MLARLQFTSIGHVEKMQVDVKELREDYDELIELMEHLPSDSENPLSTQAITDKRVEIKL